MAEASKQITVLDIARVCHEANRAWCLALGDTSQPLWEDAPEAQKISVVDGVRFRIANIDALPSANHDNWFEHKKAEGWVYGEKKDEEAKTHPNMVTHDKLPWEQRVKDTLFVNIVDGITDHGRIPIKDD